MTAATTVAPDAAAVARKRRREIMLSQRAANNSSNNNNNVTNSSNINNTVNLTITLPPSVPVPVIVPDAPPSSSAFVVADTPTSADTTIPAGTTKTVPSQETIIAPPATKKQRICPTSPTPSSSSSCSTFMNDSKKSKKPQMRYDPDIPMTKEEAAVWRREQRRKRNRESAAASRQRQRDRISELEVEVEQWKQRYDEIMTKIAQHQEAPPPPVLPKGTVDLIDSLPLLGIPPPQPTPSSLLLAPPPSLPTLPEIALRRVSSDSEGSLVPEPPSPIATTSTFIDTSNVLTNKHLPVAPAIVLDSDKEEEEEENTNNTISNKTTTIATTATTTTLTSTKQTNHLTTMISRPAQSRIANLISCV